MAAQDRKSCIETGITMELAQEPAQGLVHAQHHQSILVPSPAWGCQAVGTAPWTPQGHLNPLKLRFPKHDAARRLPLGTLDLYVWLLSLQAC